MPKRGNLPCLDWLYNRSAKKIEGELSFATADLADAQYNVSWLRWSKERAEKWTPETAFGTIIAIVIYLIAGTAIKEVFLVANLMLVDRISQLTSFNLAGNPARVIGSVCPSAHPLPKAATECPECGWVRSRDAQ